MGFVQAFRDNSKIGTMGLLGCIPVWLFAMRYRVSDQYVFFLPAYLILVMMSGYAFQRFIQSIGVKFRVPILAAVMLLPPFFYELAPVLARTGPGSLAFHARKSYKGGLRYYLRPGLRGIPDMFDYVTPGPEGAIRIIRPPGIEDELWNRLSLHAVTYYTLTGDYLPP